MDAVLPGVDFSTMSEDECQKILMVIQRDFDLRQREQDRLNKIEEEIVLEDSKSEILSRKKAFNDNCCMRCFSRFFFIFNQKVQCISCRFFVCKNCSSYEKDLKEYVCNVCEKQRELLSQSSEWFYRNVKKKFKRFGSAKVVRSLYKRKTDSDSENEMAYHPQMFTNSLPIGRKSRNGLDDLFRDDTVDGSLPVVCIDEDIIIQQTADRKYKFPQWGESERETFEKAVEGSVMRFRNQLHNISGEVRLFLREKEEQEDVTQGGVCDLPDYDKKLSNHRSQVTSAVLNFARGLHQAIDNEVFRPGADRESRRVIVQELLQKETADFTRSPLTLGDRVTECTGSSDCSCHKPLVERCSQAIFSKILGDYKRDVEERLRKEEDDLDHALTKLTNHATLTQLNDLVSESDPDHPYSSATSCLDDTVSDLESKLSDGHTGNNESFETALTGGLEDSGERVLSSPKSSWEDLSDKTMSFGKVASVNSSFSDLEIDDIVRNNMIEDDWKIIESTTSDFLSTGPHLSGKALVNGHQKDSAESSVETVNVKEELCSLKETFEASTTITTADNDGSISPTGSVSTVTEELAQIDEPEEADEDAVFEFLTKKRDTVPLPGFDSESSNEFGDIDIDDFSQQPGRESSDGNWGFRRSFLDHPISPYDNCGEKRVGNQGDGPQLMFVPKGGAGGTLIGGRPTEELSSDLSEEEASDDSEAGNGNKTQYYESMMRSKHHHTAQNGTPMHNGHTDSDEAPTPEPQKEKKPVSEMDLPPVSTEGEETDPKFTKRPVDLEVTEGEVMHLDCVVEGTGPLDVFWYKGMAAVNQLEEDDRCDVRQVGSRYSAEVHTCTADDAGQYLCIGINENGKCAQSFKVTIKPNTNETKAPEFIKALTDVDAVVGDYVKLRCKVKGLPLPRVVWYKDGKRIVSTNSCQVERVGNRDYTLTLNYVTLDDDAEYAVVAKNIAGQAKSSIQVLVEPADDFYVPRHMSARPSSLGDSLMSTGSLMSPDSDNVSLASTQGYNNIYPDTEELMKVAAQISESQSRVDKTATRMMRSANTISNLNNDLNEMDKKLGDMEREVVMPTDAVNNNNNLDEIFDTSDLVKEEQRLLAAARNVREVTASALDILTSAEQVIDSSSPVEVNVTPTDKDSNLSDEEVDVHFTYEEFEKLFAAGKVTPKQMRRGTVKRKELESIQAFLTENSPMEEDDRVSHDLVLDDPLPIDCGLKRVDSKRYKRDYVINRNGGVGEKKRRDDSYIPPYTRDVVKSTPAGLREDARQEIAMNWNSAEEQDPLFETEEDYINQVVPVVDPDQCEEEIYVNAGRVFSLEEQIKSLESSVEAIDETTGADKLAQLEGEVAQAAAEVMSSEKEVSRVVAQVDYLQQNEVQSSTLHPASAASVPEGKVLPEEPVLEHSDDYGRDSLDLPSVKKLTSRFDELEAKKDPSSVRRVYSLTGRDIPRTVREKLRGQRPSLVSSAGVTSTDRTQPQQCSSVHHIFLTSPDSSTDDKLQSSTQTVTSDKASGSPVIGSPGLHHDTPSETFMHSKELKTPSVNSTPSPVSDQSPNWTLQRATPPSSPIKRPTHTASTSSIKSGRDSTIMARAAFWDKRITSGESSDEKVITEFPDLPTSTFRDHLDD